MASTLNTTPSSAARNVVDEDVQTAHLALRPCSPHELSIDSRPTLPMSCHTGPRSPEDPHLPTRPRLCAAILRCSRRGGRRRELPPRTPSMSSFTCRAQQSPARENRGPSSPPYTQRGPRIQAIVRDFPLTYTDI
ncbi:hypothetical protein OH76DRAFT_1490614 [Lentinus brumalis]|uniref:Uncharacterized protein n=1 Tax=Lentinus brumalis TaxID=2498619 RepID=A0A371CID1_9APHY|nr:hypothetical protein OH76DRAFT_1490614 [Polyporus brumalis]